jgi:uncharacterized membrane protein
MKSNRLSYLDWTRGLAVLLMLQGHLMDAWVRPQDRGGEWFWLSQFLGGLPAPIFLFLVGVSLGLVLDRMRSRGATSADLARKVLRRGSWILCFAYAFRLEQFVVWYPASAGSDVLKVDTLNCIGVCTIIIGLLSVAFRTRRANIVAMGTATLGVVFATPFAYSVRSLPSFILAYLNGNAHPWYFSIFPWAGFTFAGITFGYLLLEGRDRFSEREFFRGVAVAGVLIYAAGAALGFVDYSFISPHYFFVRLGWLLLVLYGAYLWSTRVAAAPWSPLIVLGQASLIVYWIHIEIVYGRLFQDFTQSMELVDAATHLLWLVPLMILLASAGRIQSALSEMALRMLPMNPESDSGK